MKIFTEQRNDFTLITIQLTETAITPPVLKRTEFPSVNPRKGIVIAGNYPNWLVSAFVCQYNYCPWVAVKDEKFGAVIVASHHPNKTIGDCVSTL